jgi:hypothetical protein
MLVLYFQQTAAGVPCIYTEGGMRRSLFGVDRVGYSPYLLFDILCE